MKRRFLTGAILGTFLFTTGTFAGTLKVGASPVPHAELLNLVKEDLKKEGVDLQVIEFTDIITPNEALISKDLDANYFQHIQRLEIIIQKEKKAPLVPIAKVHVEPLGLYSKKIKNIEDLRIGSTIAIPSEPTNEGRALILLHNKGIIKLKDPTNLLATPFDILENPKKLKFKEIDIPLLVRSLDDVECAIITGNFVMNAGYKPNKDAILLEGKDSPYINILVARKDNKENEDIKKLGRALTSEKVKKYILNNYDGAVIPAF